MKSSRSRGVAWERAGVAYGNSGGGDGPETPRNVYMSCVHACLGLAASPSLSVAVSLVFTWLAPTCLPVRVLGFGLVFVLALSYYFIFH